MSNYRFILERYRGRNTRYTCPQCGRKHTFTRYIDTENNNQYLSERVGKCNRLDKCGYHYTPREYFADNPWLREEKIVPFHKNIGFWNDGTERYSSRKPAPPKPKVWVLPEGVTLATEGDDSAHMRWLSSCYGEEETERVARILGI